MANSAPRLESQQSLGDSFVDAFNSSPSYIIPKGISNGSENQAEGNESPKLNPRSCVTCRRRKVRCDKHEPCSNCVKANIDCIFPPPGRAPRKPRKPHDAELLKRLRRLESVVDSLGAQVDEDGNPTHDGDGLPPPRGTPSDPTSEWPPPGARKSSLELGLGRLVIKEGRSRYVSNDFWASLGDEIAEMRDILDGPSSEEDEDMGSPVANSDQTNHFQHHQGFVFGYSSLMIDMAKVHPSPSQIFIIWEVFKENIDPVLKVVHTPTVKNVIMKAAVSASSLTKPSEALFYSICFAAVVSMNEDQCHSLLDEAKDKLMQKYRFAVEQGLARAGFLNSSSLMVLQAFVMYLMVVRYVDSSKAIWSLAGLAMQQAQAQGLHRDGTNFELDAFETEIRRRLWWHISLLDARAAEDHGADPTFSERFYDTRMPMNINDEDIWPGMKEVPKPRSGASDMTFCLMRFELANTQRKLRLTSSSSCPSEARQRTLEEKEQLIDKTHQHIEEKYLQHCDPSVPLLWVTATVGRLILAKMWLMVHHPRLNAQDSNAPPDLRDRIFLTSVEVIEFGHLLESNTKTAKWGWLFRTYMQWHAVAYILSELSVKPPGPHTERAWNAIDAVYDKRMLDQAKHHRGVLWKPLKQLYAKAKSRRDKSENNSESSPHSNRSASNSDQLSPSDGSNTYADPWAMGYPYGSTTMTTGEALDMDFRDLGMMVGMTDRDIAMPQTMQDVTATCAPINPTSDAIQWSGWTPEIGDFGLGSPLPQTWSNPVKQEWF